MHHQTENFSDLVDSFSKNSISIVISLTMVRLRTFYPPKPILNGSHLMTLGCCNVNMYVSAKTRMPRIGWAAKVFKKPNWHFRVVKV